MNVVVGLWYIFVNVEILLISFLRIVGVIVVWGRLIGGLIDKIIDYIIFIRILYEVRGGYWFILVVVGLDDSNF